MEFEKFEKMLKDVKYVDNFLDKIQVLCGEFNRDNELGEQAEIWFPSMVCTVIELLEYIFEDKGEWITYFVFDLEYGEKYEDGMVTRQDGSHIKLATIRDLYDFLIENQKERHKDKTK